MRQRNVSHVSVIVLVGGWYLLQLSIRALELTYTHHLPSTYDGHYLALAEREGCTLWTADRRLWNSVGKALSWVQYLADYQPPAADAPR